MDGIGCDNDSGVWRRCGGINDAVQNKGEADGEFCSVWWCMVLRDDSNVELHGIRVGRKVILHCTVHGDNNIRT